MRIPRLVRAAVAALAIAAMLGASTASAWGGIEIRRDGSKAVHVPAVPGPTTSTTADGFDLGDAGLGAATMLALVAASAGVISLRGRRDSSRPMSVS
jgi:5-enolpyruvylshikimate-3-phosphate synthase